MNKIFFTITGTKHYYGKIEDTVEGKVLYILDGGIICQITERLIDN